VADVDGVGLLLTTELVFVGLCVTQESERRAKVMAMLAR
jgi:hypothetical protein